MRRWAPHLLLTVIVLSGVAPVAAEDNPAVRLVSDVWPPFTNLAGQPAVAQDLVGEALRRAGVTAEIEIADDFAGAMAGLRNGSFDGSAAIWKNAQREEFLLYSLPFLENQLVLVGRKGSDVSATTFGDLAGKRLALVESYDYGPEPEAAEGVEIVPGRSDQENLDRLLAGEVDYLLVDDLLVQYGRQVQPEQIEHALEVAVKPLVRKSLHFAVRRDLPDAQSIIERFNVQIRRMMTDGTYNRVLQLSWIQVDVDGDGYLEYVMSTEGAGKTAPEFAYNAVWPGSDSVENRAHNEYWIEGQRYDSWSAVPDIYKVGDTLSGGPASPALSLFKVSF